MRPEERFMTEQESCQTQVALITFLVQPGRSALLVDAARDAGAQGASVYHPTAHRPGNVAGPVQRQQDMVNVLVTRENLDRVLARMYAAGHLQAPTRTFISAMPWPSSLPRPSDADRVSPAHSGNDDRDASVQERQQTWAGEVP
jgi:nitrogen regulatory protein P-II 1